MKLNYFFTTIFVFLLSMVFYGQTEVLSFNIDTKSPKSKKTTYSLVNATSGNFAFLIKDKKQIHAHHFDSDFKAISNFSFEPPKRKYLEPLGYSAFNNTYNLLYANRKFSDLVVISVDFDTKTSSTKELEFQLGDELYIETVVHNNKLLLLSSDKKSIILRTLTKNNELKTLKTFETNDISISDRVYGKYPDFWSFFSTQIEESTIEKIEHKIPTSIEQAASPCKLYHFDDKLILTLEDDKNQTLAYTINLEDFSISQRSFKYPKGKIDDYKKYNSFIFKDKVFQLASSRKEMSFQVKDLSDKLLKEFYITKEDSITFKNGPIVQEGITALPFQTRRELEASSKYLRKISSGKIGVSVLKVDLGYEITIGGYKIVPTNTVGFGVGFGGTGGVFIPNGTGGGFAPVFNTTYYNFSAFNSTKATFFDTVLTNEFEHIKKEFEPTINDRIDNFMVDYKGITGEDLFFTKDTPYYTYYNQKDKEFLVVRF